LWIRVNITLLADYAGKLQGMWLLYSYARTYLLLSLQHFQHLPIDKFLNMKMDIAHFLGTCVSVHSPTGNWSFHNFTARSKILKSMKLKAFGENYVLNYRVLVVWNAKLGTQSALN
jgi:hypothetical protein